MPQISHFLCDAWATITLKCFLESSMDAYKKTVSCVGYSSKCVLFLHYILGTGHSLILGDRFPTLRRYCYKFLGETQTQKQAIEVRAVADTQWDQWGHGPNCNFNNFNLIPINKGNDNLYPKISHIFPLITLTSRVSSSSFQKNSPSRFCFP